MDVTELHIPAEQFQSPHFQFKLIPSKGVQFHSNGGAIPVKGLWKAYYEVIGITVIILSIFPHQNNKMVFNLRFAAVAGSH